MTSAHQPRRWRFGMPRRAGLLLAVPAVLAAVLAATLGAVPMSATLAGAAAGQRLPAADPVDPDPNPWDTWSWDFGSTPGRHSFIFTNVYRLPMVDKPLPLLHADQFRLIGDGCTVPINPGQSCVVTVAYTPTPGQVRPVTDMLRLQFTDSAGQPVSTRGAYLFGGGAEYVTTDNQSGVFTLPDTPTNQMIALIIFYRLHGPNPKDLPPLLFTPWHVLRNTCATVAAGAGGCEVTIGFQPTAPGTVSINFQMSFDDPVTQQTVTTQPLILTGTGV